MESRTGSEHLWAYPEGLEKSNWLVATYFVELPRDASSLAAASEMAIGQSTGTWVDLPADVKERVRSYDAKVLAAYQIPPTELRNDEQPDIHYLMRIAYPSKNFGNDLSLLLTTLVGNESSTSQVLKLLDIELPESLMTTLPGPQFGIDGIRNMLGVFDRPLLNNMIKPCIGLSPEAGATIVYQTVLGGVDIIKDDELLADQEFSPIEQRVKHYKDAIKRVEVETGHKALYAVNISGRVDRIRENALRAVEAGADIVMVSYLSVGLSAIQALAEAPEISVPVLAHTNLAPIWYESPTLGMSSNLIVGKLPRLAGADIVVQTSPYGKYPIMWDRYRRYTQALTLRLKGLKPSFPLVAGGVHPRVVPKLIEDLGVDFIVGAGGAIQGHPDGSTAGAMAMRQALDAGVAGIAIEEYAEEHNALRVAIGKWR